MKKIALICFSFAFLAAFSGSANAQDCKLDSNGSKDVPSSGSTVTIEKGKYKKIGGTITAGGSAVSGAKYALFRLSGDKETFIGSADATDGKFCVGGLSDGKYVLRIGSAGHKAVDFKFAYELNNEWAQQGKIKIELTQ